MFAFKVQQMKVCLKNKLMYSILFKLETQKLQYRGIKEISNTKDFQPTRENPIINT